MKNEYEIRGENTAIMLHSNELGKLEAIISTKQLQKADEFPNSWRPFLDRKRRKIYVVGKVTIDKRPKTYYFHRWLTDAPDGMEVDHANHNGLDNRIENLRVVTTAENQQNRRGAPRNSKSRIRGVHWYERLRKWEVQIKVNNKKIWIGYFDDLEEAKKASIEARKKYMPFSNEEIS